MQTIIQASLPVRSMSENTYYFAHNKETGKSVAAYLTNTYRSYIDSGDSIVFIFGSSSGPNEILYLPAEKFYNLYTLTGRVNSMIFE